MSTIFKLSDLQVEENISQTESKVTEDKTKESELKEQPLPGDRSNEPTSEKVRYNSSNIRYFLQLLVTK